jgi:hypothetical protein
MTDSELEIMIDFFIALEKLALNQEPLGAEFQKVLDENRWEMYEK